MPLHQVLKEPTDLFFGCGYSFFSVLTEEDIKSTRLKHIDLLSYLLSDSLDEISKVVMGCSNIFFITKFGKLLVCGNNQYGVLMTGDSFARPFPVYCKYLQDEFIVDVSISCCHSLILTRTGKVYACGLNFYGENGHSEYNSTDPKLLSNFYPRVVKVFAFPTQSFVILKNRNIYACGKGYSCEPTLCNTSVFYLENNVDIQVVGMKTFWLKDDSLKITGLGVKNPGLQFPSSEKYSRMACANDHVILIGNESNSSKPIIRRIDITKNSTGEIIEIPFIWDGEENVEVAADENATLLMKKQNNNFSTLEYEILKMVLEHSAMMDKHLIDNTTCHVFRPLVDKVSKSFSTILRNGPLMNSLSALECEKFEKLIHLFLLHIDYESSLNDLPISDWKDLIFYLFILNDVVEPVPIKGFLFDKFSEEISKSTAVEMLELISSYLEKHLLSNSSHSILMVMVQKCLAFIAENILYKKEPKLEKLWKRIESQKKSFNQVIWSEPQETVESIFLQYSSLFDGLGQFESDVKITLGDDKVYHLHKCVLSTFSPVISILFTDSFADTSSQDFYQFDLFGFLKDDMLMNDESKRKYLKILLQSFYAIIDPITELSMQELLEFHFICELFQVKILNQYIHQLMGDQLSVENAQLVSEYLTMHSADENDGIDMLKKRLVIFSLQNSMKINNPLLENYKLDLKWFRIGKHDLDSKFSNGFLITAHNRDFKLPFSVFE